MHRDAYLRAVADTAPRRVQDAPQAHRVIGVGDGAQVGDDVTHFLTLVELRAADHLVRDAVADEDFLHCTRAGVGAVEDGDIG